MNRKITKTRKLGEEGYRFWDVEPGFLAARATKLVIW